MIYVLTVCLVLTGLVSAREDLWSTEAGRARVFDALVETFKSNYWNEGFTDWDAWAERYREEAVSASTRADFDRALALMVQDLNDEHSYWLGRSYGVADVAPQAPMIGIRHSFIEGMGVVVRRVYPQTPAAKAGLVRGDLILTINGKDVTGLSYSGEVSRAFAEAIGGGTVTLGVRRALEPLEITVSPAPISFARLQNMPSGRMLDATTGYIYLPSFESETVGQELHSLVRDLKTQGARGLVLDLRGNPGGRVGQLGLVLGAFLKQDEPWAQAVSRGEIAWRPRYRLAGARAENVLESLDGRAIARDELSTPTTFDGPLAILVNEQNSSAGEIMPLVLQHLDRATIIGTATGGNVEAIRGFDLPDGSQVLVAVANLEALDGVSFVSGVTPDIEAQVDLEELARGYDAPVAEAVRVLKALPFTPGKFF